MAKKPCSCAAGQQPLGAAQSPHKSHWLRGIESEAVSPLTRPAPQPLISFSNLSSRFTRCMPYSTNPANTADSASAPPPAAQHSTAQRSTLKGGLSWGEGCRASMLCTQHGQLMRVARLKLPGCRMPMPHSLPVATPHVRIHTGAHCSSGGSAGAPHLKHPSSLAAEPSAGQALLRQGQSLG
jgi:hypothetical protein